MPSVTNVSLQAAIGGWRGGNVGAVVPLGALTSIRLQQQVAGGSPIERVFSVAHDVRDDTYDVSAEGTETFSTQLTSQEALLETILDTELYTDEERALYNGEDFCPYPLVLPVEEATADAPIPELEPPGDCEDVRPTWLEICQRVADHIGFGLVVYDGPGLPFNDRKVDGDYTTMGKTAQTVLSETLLSTQPRWWGVEDIIHIDGRPLLAGALPTLQYTTLSRRTERAAEITEPVLPTDDPCDDLFETTDDYTLNWTEATGNIEDYSRLETEHTIIKENGQVMTEIEERRGYFNYLSGERPFGTYYHMLRKHVYIEGCKGALIKTCETVNEASLEMTYWDVPVLEDPDIRNLIYQIKDFVPPLLTTSYKETFQRWHAEGWLFSRNEVNLEAAAFAKNLDGSAIFGYIPMKRSERSETYIPIGNGLWRIQVVEKFPSELPIYEQDGDFIYTATYPISKTNFYAVETDQSPPTITCPPPCGPQTSEEEAQEQYDFEVAKRDAILANQPDLYVDTLTVPGLLLSYEVGQFKGAAFVSGVSYEVNHESGTASTTVELMRAVA